MGNKIAKNAMILTVITLVSGLLLGLVFEITKEPIAQAQENAKQEAYKEVFAEADEFEAYSDFDAKAAEKAVAEAGYADDTIDEVVVANAGGEAAGYVITVTSHEGYGGDIQFTMGVKNDGTMNGISILSISETAGLGMKAAEPEFQAQFKDKQVEKFEYTKTGASSDEQIDALSGATITTNAMTNGVNAGLAYFQNVLGGSANE